MSMSIGGVGGYAASMMYPGMGGKTARERPEAGEMVDRLFSELDTTGKGYLEKTDLVSAFENLDSGSASSASVDEVFGTLDSDADGKLTKEEMTAAMQKLAEELDSQFNALRASGMGGMEAMRGMPPPPPLGGSADEGLTRDEVTELAETTGDSKLAEMMSNLAANFDDADADGDGKVTFQEAMAYQAAQGAEGTTETASASTSGTETSAEDEAAILRRIMDLLRAYSWEDSDGALLGTLSETA